MKSLVRRARLSGELAMKLRDKGFSEDEIDAALVCLAQNGLIDDDGAITAHLESRIGKRSVGSGKLRAELLRKGATEDQIEGTLALRDDSDEIDAMIEALSGRTWQVNDRNRAGRFLASRGFDVELIETAIVRHFGSDEE